MKRILLILTFLLFCTPLQASSPGALSMAELSKACSSKDKSWIGFCDGYIQSAIDFINLHRIEVCIPTDTTRNSIFEKLAPNLLSKKESNGDNALISLVQMISDSYKCS